MHQRLILAILLFSGIPAIAPALAQVTVDQRALEPLQPAPPPAKAQAVRPKGSTVPAKPTTPSKQVPAKVGAAKPTTSPANVPPGGMTIRPNPGAPPAQPSVRAAPPPTIALPPPILVPTRPTQPAPPPTVTADSPSTTQPLQGGLRVTFGSGRADLNPGNETVIRNLASGGDGQAPVPDSTSFTITSYAAGTPEDPSTARRLSLSRALALRSVLISQGITSVRIYVKALGPTSPGFADGPPDRADITITANPVPAQNVTSNQAKPR